MNYIKQALTGIRNIFHDERSKGLRRLIEDHVNTDLKISRKSICLLYTPNSYVQAGQELMGYKKQITE